MESQLYMRDACDKILGKKAQLKLHLFWVFCVVVFFIKHVSSLQYTGFGNELHFFCSSVPKINFLKSSNTENGVYVY